MKGAKTVRILRVTSSLDPRSGGPAEGLRQSSQALTTLGHTIDVLTLDSAAAPYLAEFPLTVHALGPARGRYAYTARLIPWLESNAPRFEAIIVEGLWQFHGFGVWRVLHGATTPYFVYPHGMLDPWFKRTYPLKHLKKWLYWPWAEYRVLRDARAVIFTSEEERRLARESFWLYSANEAVLPYGTREPPQDGQRLKNTFLSAHPGLRDKRVWLFLGRIHKKKGCDLLIDGFARVAAADSRLRLIVAGPDQTGWLATLKAQAERRGIAGRIIWPGMLEGDLKWGAFYASEVFILPSRQENLGIAVIEALGCGRPVLISDKINIWHEIEADAAGLVGSDTVEGTADLLRRWMALFPVEARAMGERARACFQRRFDVNVAATALSRLLEDQVL
jgi:glycosyltransferase involved in cell wall biosynthesis